MYLRTVHPRRSFTDKPGVEFGFYGVFSGSRSAEDPVYEGGFGSVLTLSQLVSKQGTRLAQA